MGWVDLQYLNHLLSDSSPPDAAEFRGPDLGIHFLQRECHGLGVFLWHLPCSWICLIVLSRTDTDGNRETHLEGGWAGLSGLLAHTYSWAVPASLWSLISLILRLRTSGLQTSGSCFHSLQPWARPWSLSARLHPAFPQGDSKCSLGSFFLWCWFPCISGDYLWMSPFRLNSVSLLLLLGLCVSCCERYLWMDCGLWFYFLFPNIHPRFPGKDPSVQILYESVMIGISKNLEKFLYFWETFSFTLTMCVCVGGLCSTQPY